MVHHGGGLDLVLDAGSGTSSVLLRPDLRADLHKALTTLPADVHFVLIRTALPNGFSGPDMPHPDDAKAPTVDALCAAIEDCARPVAVLVEGLASGRGAELLLAAHLRLATPAARICFPALHLGRLPQSGALLRLPRSVGAEQSLRLIRAGKPVPAVEALAIGLLDQVLDQEGPDAVQDAARRALAALDAPRRSLSRDAGLRDARRYLATLAEARSAGPAPGLAPEAETALIDCLEATLLLPVAQGLGFAATKVEEIARTGDAAALTYLHRAELRAAAVPQALAAFEAAAVRHLGVAGADPALAGLVLTALARGLAVTVTDPARDRLVAFLETLAARQEAAVKAGQMTAAQRDADWARLSPGLDAKALVDTGLIVAASGEGLPHPTATLPVLVAGRGDLPQGAFRLVLTGRMAELALPASSPGQAALTAWAFLRRMGLQVVITGQQTAVGIAGRLSIAGGAAVRAMTEMGVSPEAIRAALGGFGQALGQLPPSSGPSRTISEQEILHRWLGALANEAARLMQAGVVANASDIDLVAVAGLGFPRRRGGPMHQADQRGVMIVRRDLAMWQADAPVWAPVGALDALVSLGRGFAGAVRTE